jgi:hypothetical protein
VKQTYNRGAYVDHFNIHLCGTVEV